MGEGWKMFVVHVRWRRLALLGAAIAAVLALTLLLSGCLHGKAQPAEAVPAATAEERAAYLAGFGWQIAPEPVETLHLQLPEDLSAEWRDYLKLQQSQGLPFGDYAGCEAERYTYNILNYPGVERGVQANIFVAGGIVIAGDVVSTGEQSFQQGLAFPESGG